MNTCVVEKGSSYDSSEEETSIFNPNKKDKTDNDEDDDDNEIDDSLWGGEFTTQQPSINTRVGQCALPVQPGRDPELTKNSGLRFGTRKQTYLEFNKKLRIKRRSSFGIEFKTEVSDGIIFYIADEKNNDFIALFVKNGVVSENPTHIIFCHTNHTSNNFF